MFPPQWGRDPRMPDLPYLLSPRSHHRPSISRPYCPDPYGTHSPHSSHTKKHKPARFSSLDPPFFPSSDWDDTYALDTDSSISPSYHSPPRRRSPALSRIALTLPSATAHALHPRDVLVLPPLVHLHILLSTPHTRGPQDIHVAVPRTMAFGQTIKQVVHTYVGEGVKGCDVTARVEQRGRMREPGSEVLVGDLAEKGEVWKDGRREVRVEVLVEDGKGGFVKGRGKERGPWGGGADVDVEMGIEGELGRTRFACV